MFGMGMGELLLILVVALLVVGPDKLPQAAKAIGRGIRDFRRHSHDLQSTLEQDEKLGEAVRELKSALRDDPLRWRPSTKPTTPKPAAKPGAPTDSASTESATNPDGPPTVVPAAGAVAKQASPPRESAPPIDARPDPRPGTNRSTEADDPAHG
jgi:sec-independent protein translocase protein TatB